MESVVVMILETLQLNNDSFLMKSFSIAVANHTVLGKLIQDWRKKFHKEC